MFSKKANELMAAIAAHTPPAPGPGQVKFFCWPNLLKSSVYTKGSAQASCAAVPHKPRTTTSPLTCHCLDLDDALSCPIALIRCAPQKVLPTRNRDPVTFCNVSS